MILGSLGQLWALGAIIVFILFMVLAIKTLREKEPVSQEHQTQVSSPVEREPKEGIKLPEGKVIEPERNPSSSRV